MSHKKTMSAIAVTTGVAQALASSVTNTVKTEIESLIVRFTDYLHLTHDYDRELMLEGWAKIAPDYINDLQLAIQKEDKKKESEIKRLQKKEEEKKGPHCQYEYGEKAKHPHTECGAFCRDPNPAEDGKTYCNPHRKQVASRHDCEFRYGPTATEEKRGRPCGTRVSKSSTVFDHEGEYEGHDYCGKWLCGLHSKQVSNALTAALNRKNNQCTHVTTKSNDPEKNDKQCASTCVPGADKCKKHLGKKTGKSKEDTEERKKAKTADDAEKKSSKAKPSSIKSDTEEEKHPVPKLPKPKKPKVEKFEVKVSFKLTKGKPKKTEWVSRKVVGEDGEFTAFIDTNSGLVCGNPDDRDNPELDMDSLQAIGMWNNETQTYDELDEPAKEYAQALDIPVVSYEEEDAE